MLILQSMMETLLKDHGRMRMTAFDIGAMICPELEHQHTLQYQPVPLLEGSWFLSNLKTKSLT